MRFKEVLASNAGALLRFVPIGKWPASVSRLTGVVAPRAVVPHPDPSSAGGANVKILFDLLERTSAIPGDVAECGVWRGRSLVAMGLYLQQQGSRKTIFGFDSFQGFDASVKRDFPTMALRAALSAGRLAERSGRRVRISERELIRQLSPSANNFSMPAP